MGVDTNIYLPANVRIGEVAKVAGILAGLTPAKIDIGGRSWYTSVSGAETSTCLPEMARITVTGNLIGNPDHGWSCTYHYESGRDWRYIRLISQAYPLTIAIGRRLVEFFGGCILHSDWDGDEPDYTHDWRTEENYPSNGDAWHEWQQAMFDVTPITKAELNAAREWAAYK